MFSDDVKKLNPEAPVISVNGMTGEGVQEWTDLLREKIREKKAHAR